MALRKGRILRLAKLLEADAQNDKGIRFDMATWGTIGDPKKRVSCDTRACAMGLAALSNEFKNDGLTCKVRDFGIHFYWKGKPVGGMEAARKLFGMSNEEVDSFFALGPHPQVGAEGELHLAGRLKRFAARL